MQTLRLKVFIVSCLSVSPFCKLFAETGGECQQSFSSSQELEIVKATNPQDLNKHLSEGALLSRGQGMEWLAYSRRSLGGTDGKKLDDVFNITGKYRDKLNKRPVREQEITFTVKQRTPPESLNPFLQSFRSHAHKVRKIFQISENWGYWAKLLNFKNPSLNKKEQRAEFFKYLASGPMGESIGEFIQNQGLSFNVSTEQTVREFIENPLSGHRKKTIVLYKVLEVFRQELTKGETEELDINLSENIKHNLSREINENLSIAMAELIHVTGFGNPILTEQLKSKDPLVIMEAVRQIFLERDAVAISLGFTQDHYQDLKNSLLDAFQSLKVKSTISGLNQFLDQEAEILQDLSHQPEVASYTQTFRMRALSLQESPFRGCLGKECSTRLYFEIALDPAYLYFTLTDKQFVSHGHITIVLGTANNPSGEKIKTAFVDNIQNIPNHRIVGMLSAIQLSLSEQGYKLALSTNVGKSNMGLSNVHLTRDFVEHKILPSLKNPLKLFQPENYGLPFKRYPRDYSNLLEFEWTQAKSDFDIHPLQIPQPKKLDESFKIKDWLLKAMESDKEKDQLLAIANIANLIKFNIVNEKEAIDYLQSRIEDKSLSFELRKQALFAFIQLQIESALQNLEFLTIDFSDGRPEILTGYNKKALQDLESLMLNFSEKELTTIIGEMSTWKKTTGYRKRFTLFLSHFFTSDSLSAVMESDIPMLFERVADLNKGLYVAIKDEHYESIQFLLDKGANINSNDDYGPPLHYAIGISKTEIVQILLDRGANPNSKAELTLDYNTPLHLAIITNNPEIIQILLDKGANPNIKDRNGRTPLELSASYLNVEIYKMLRTGGGKPSINSTIDYLFMRLFKFFLIILGKSPT